MSGGADRQIEKLLEQAARGAQPHSRGWDTLADRLAATPQIARPRYGRWAVFAAAATILVSGGLALYFATAPVALAQPAPIQVVPQDIEFTVFNETETQGQPLYMPLGQLLTPGPAFEPQAGGQFRRSGQRPANSAVQYFAYPQYDGWGRPMVKSGMALVKDHRLVLNLQKGDNIVRFTDVAATIDPTSVRFVSDTDPAGAIVVEQNFEYDLATSGAILNRYIDKQIACISKDGIETGGYLCSYDDDAVVLTETPPGKGSADRKTQTLSRDQLRAIRLADVPPDLYVKPTLVWKLRTQRPGRHDTTLSYLCGETKWNADYVAVVTPGNAEQGDRIDLQGWVTIDNRSGATYRDAKIKLIAGDVNRVPDPWAVMPALNRSEGRTLRWFFEDADSSNAMGGAGFVEKSFFEYHLYTLSVPSTVKDQQIKQLKLLKADGVKAKRLYVSEQPRTSDDYSSHAQVRLVLCNEESNALGMPLPKGHVRLLQRDADGDLGLIGETDIDHTPKDEEIKLTLGEAFDVTAERTVVGLRIPSDRREIVTFELRMRNHKDEPINARIVEPLIDGRNWTIPETTAWWTRENVNTIHFDFALAPNQGKTITYTVDYQW